MEDDKHVGSYNLAGKAELLRGSLCKQTEQNEAGTRPGMRPRQLLTRFEPSVVTNAFWIKPVHEDGLSHLTCAQD